jgi:adenylate cyclase
MLTKIVKFFGVFLIILFSMVSIFLSVAERDLDDPAIKEITGYTSFFEDRFYDVRMRQTLDPELIDKRIILARIDDNSLHEVGRWPWSRVVWTKFVRKMHKFGAKVLAFDVFFSEPEKSCGGVSLDKRFAEAIMEFQSTEGNKVILPYSLDTYGAEAFEEIPDSLYNFIMDTKQSEGLNLMPQKISKAVYPIEDLINADVALGHIQAQEDADGIFRHYKLAANVDTLYFPSFSLLTYESYTGKKTLLELLQAGNSILKVDGKSLSINYKGESKVRWIGGETSFPSVAINDILNAKDDDQEMIDVFNGNIVFIGSTAFGAHDLRHTPVDPMLPGVYFHMNMTHMLLEGKFFKSKDDSAKISWGIILVGTMLMILVMILGNAILDLFTMLTITIGFFIADTFYLTPAGYEIKLFFCLFSVVACYSWITFLNFYLASKDKTFLKNAFGSYISPELIDEMYKTGEPPKLGGDCGTRTAFFTDIQGFSTFSEKLTATQLVELLNEYLTAMTDILLGHKGTLDKYEGDAIIAFFGAPMPLEDHAVKACQVALDMQSSLDELRVKWTDEGDKWPQIVHEMRMRIGINSGEIVTGNMGSKSRMNYTMMGDSVNLAARLEEAAKQYGIFTQISEFTKELTGDTFIMRELDTVKVVGKSEPVTTYDLLGEKGKTSDELMKLQELFHKGLDLYKNQKWDEATKTFNESLEYEYKRFPDLKGKKTNPSLIYIDRCEEFKKNPPPENWDGVYTLTSK